MELTFQCSPEEAVDDLWLRKYISKELKLTDNKFEYRWRKRSIDARKRDIKINASLEIFPDGVVPEFDADCQGRWREFALSAE